MSEIIKSTERTRTKRVPKNANYERLTIHKILDEGFLCHIGFAVDEQPFVLPTAYARDGDNLLIHGSSASRMMRAMASEIDVCVSVTLVDGLVLARSAFHHSMNYRSVVIVGKAQVVREEAEKTNALRALTEHIVPGRWKDVRPPNEKELKATIVLSLPLQEASAKIRTGAPVDDAEDYSMNVWAGVIPLSLKAGKPIDDARLKKEIQLPPSVAGFKIGL